MSTATLERPAAKAKKASPAPLTIDIIDRFTSSLAHASAALSMMEIVYCGEAGLKPSDIASTGMMGSLQFAQQTLNDLQKEVNEWTRPLDDAYWGVFFAASLVTLLDDLMGADGYDEWERYSSTMICDVLSAAQAGIARAQGALSKGEGSC